MEAQLHNQHNSSWSEQQNLRYNLKLEARIYKTKKKIKKTVSNWLHFICQGSFSDWANLLHRELISVREVAGPSERSISSCASDACQMSPVAPMGRREAWPPGGPKAAVVNLTGSL